MCDKRKPIDRFYKASTTKDGRRGYCGDCSTLKIRNFRASGTTRFNNYYKDLTIKQLTTLYNEVAAELIKRKKR